MRYAFAFIGALIAAAVATLFMSGSLASMLVAGMRFESPDDVASMHVLLFMGFNLLALVVGWLIGLAIGIRFEKPEERI